MCYGFFELKHTFEFDFDIFQKMLLKCEVNEANPKKHIFDRKFLHSYLYTLMFSRQMIVHINMRRRRRRREKTKKKKKKTKKKDEKEGEEIEEEEDEEKDEEEGEEIEKEEDEEKR